MTTATAWAHTVTVRDYIDAAQDDSNKIPALLEALAAAVALVDAEDSFADDLREAAEGILELDNVVEEGDFWLNEFYNWADNCRVWVD